MTHTNAILNGQFSESATNFDNLELINGLQAIPSSWVLTPVDGNKRPYRLDWQKEEPLSRDEIAAEIKSGKAKGYGIRTGEVSGGLLSTDCDGASAKDLLREKAAGDLPNTVIFSSGKPGRGQLLYRVPEEYWSVIKTIKLKTGVKGEDGKEEQLEFRWNGCQSVLPPSVHPETGAYHWVESPQDIEIAECPMWVIELMLNHNQPAPKNPAPKQVYTPPSITARPPLEIFLGRDDRALVEGGAGDGSRNDAAQKLSLNLIATARRLTELGIDYDGDPRSLYDQFCARCTPPLGSDVRGEDEGWWRKADLHALHPSLDDEKLENCYKAWLGKQSSEQKRKERERGMPIVNGTAVYSEDERLRLELLDLAQEKNKIAYVRKRATICSFYRINKAEVEDLIKETERKTLTNGLQRSSLDDLLEMEIQELTWLIPELLPVGEMVILAGSPKSGKTLMAIDAAFAIATGEDDFLGLRPQRGKVLLVSNDENARSTKSKLIKRGFRSGDGKNLEVIFNWNIAQMYELEQVLDDFRPDVVVIDSLKSITAHNGEISENSAEFANNIYALKNLLNQYNAASILIHHTSKNKEAMGVAKLRGSSAIAGAVWGTWQLDHIPKPDPNGGKGLIIDPSDPRRILSVFARDVEGQLLALEFDPENNSYARTDKETIKEQNTMTDRILSVLRLNPHGLSGRDIIECLGMTREEGGRGVYTTLNRMEAKLLVSTIKSLSDRRVTLYILKNGQHVDVTDCKLVNRGGDSLSPPPSVEIVDYSSESNTQYGLQNSQQKNQNSQQHTENSQQLLDTNTTDDNSKPASNMDNSKIVNIVNTGGGERVSPKVLTNCTESPKVLKEVDNSQTQSDKQDEAISLAMVEQTGGEIAPFVGCQVEVRSAVTGKVKFSGQMTSYDNKNGCITVAAPEGDRKVSFQEAFVID